MKKSRSTADTGRKKPLFVTILAVICCVLITITIFTAVIMELVGDRNNNTPSATTSDTVISADSKPAVTTQATTSETDKSEEKAVPVVASENGKVINALLPDVMVQYDTLLILNGKAYEYYAHNDKSAHSYANVVNTVAHNLSGKSKVFSIIPPTSMGVQFPQKYRGYSHSTSQKNSISTIYSYLDEDVTAIPVYEALIKHKDENIYFKTDHHWTAYGAHYAFEEFCKAKGLTPAPLSTYRSVTFENFRGSFYKFSHEDEHLNEFEYLTAFYPLSEHATLEVTDMKTDKLMKWPIINDVTSYASSLKYAAFVGSDNSFSVITNPDIISGETCLVVKDSYGNALIPFLTDCYQKIYIVDYRYWKGSISDFAEQHGINDVVFINNLSLIRNPYTVGLLTSIE